MIDKNNLYEWQRIDPENGLIEPWLTHPFMDFIKTKDLSKKTILEFGAGASTAWWRNKSRWVDTLEGNRDWGKMASKHCKDQGLDNGDMFCKDIPDGVPEHMPEYFALIPTDKHFDIIIVDGIYRTEALQWALDHFKGRGGLLIADNWQQDYVWISPKAEEIMSPYKIHRFVQPDHTNHEGRPWNTSAWKIPA